MTNDEKALLLAEYQPLREEVNRTVDRMTNNEFVCSAAVFSIVIFQASFEYNKHYPKEFITLAIAVLCLFVAFFGSERSKVFRRHMDQVDKYLSNIERQFSQNFGWTNYYRKTIGESDTANQTGTRKVLWIVLQSVALINFALQIAVLANPNVA